MNLRGSILEVLCNLLNNNDMEKRKPISTPSWLKALALNSPDEEPRDGRAIWSQLFQGRAASLSVVSGQDVLDNLSLHYWGTEHT